MFAATKPNLLDKLLLFFFFQNFSKFSLGWKVKVPAQQDIQRYIGTERNQQEMNEEVSAK